ncbi:MAG: peptidase M16, partial [Chloroflexota bacterium]
DPQTIAASLNTVEFHLREKNTGRFPRGLSLMLGALSTWIYDGDPLSALAFEKPLNTLKEKAKGNRFFEGLIEQYLLNNSHRSSVRLIPDPEEGKRRDLMEAERLSKIKNGLSQEELSNIIALASELKLRQETPDRPEALATIPSLSLTDIDRNIRVLPSQNIQVENSTVQFHDLFTNGILYLDLGFDLHTLPQELLPYTGLLGRLLLEMGTDKEDFVKLTQRIGRDTGGIRSAVLNSSIRSSNRSAAWFFLRGKTIASQSQALLSVLQDILLSVRLDQPDRFKQIVLERKAGLEAGLLPGGSGVVNQRLRAHLNQADWVSEQMQGISHLFFLRNLLETV